jgi:hypothetical protein
LKHRKAEEELERRCAVTRRVLPAEAMIRFVAAPDGTLTPDLRRRLPGRGVWVTARASVLRQALKSRAFARSLKRDVAVADGFDARIDDLLERRALEALALAKKAGELVVGGARVEEAIRSGAACALIHAREAGEDGCERLDRLAIAIGRTQGRPVAGIRLFEGCQMDLALGRSHVIHAALLAGKASENALACCRFLAEFREEPHGGPGRRADFQEDMTLQPAGPTAA